ncbi:LysR family transcriptional regulator [Paenibacillus aurantiacus]|uniref:LysR family transcriptional regulator n=1 Tax=Paenibacillus aurantiacus TaxID=1936118 RepID=A0ABV5L025_9BACL
MLNLYALRVFHQVAESGSVTRAAERLQISQPAVTAHVRKLGEELGLALLAPRGRGVLLTEAGERVAAHAARVVALERDIARDLDGYRRGELGILRLAATSLPASCLLPARLAAYRLAYPEVRVELRTLNARTCCEALLRYEADMAVVGGTSGAEPGLDGTLLMEDEPWFVASASHPLAGGDVRLSEIAVYPFVMREAGSAAQRQLDGIFRARGLHTPPCALEVGGVRETLQCVGAGLGIALVSALEAEAAVSGGLLSRVRVADAQLPASPITLYVRSGEVPTPQAEWFARSLRSAFGRRDVQEAGS